MTKLTQYRCDVCGFVINGEAYAVTTFDPNKPYLVSLPEKHICNKCSYYTLQIIGELK